MSIALVNWIQTRQSSLRPVAALVALCLLALGGIVGCGTSEYEARTDKSLAKLRHQEPFLALAKDSVTIPDSTTRLRLPIGLSQRFTRESTNPDTGGGRIQVQQMQPQLMDVPGIQTCFQAQRTNAERRAMPYNLHIGVVKRSVDPAAGDGAAAAPAGADAPSADAANPTDVENMAAVAISADAVADTIQTALIRGLAAHAPAAAGEEPSSWQVAWESFDAPTPEIGVTIPWQRIRLQHVPQFYGLAKSRFTPEPQPGAFQVYLHDSGDQVLILVWRVPDSIADQIPVDEWAELVAGSIQ